MDLSKLQVKPPQEFFDILGDLIVKLKIIASLPIKPNEEDETEPCYPVIDFTTFKPCKDKEVQTLLNKNMMRGTCDEAFDVLENLKTELTEKGTFEVLINYVEDFCGKYLNDAAIIDEYHENIKALYKVKEDLIQFEKNKIQKKRELDNEFYVKTINYYKTQQDALVDKKLTVKWIHARIRQRELMSSIMVDKIDERTRKLDFMTLNELNCGTSIKNFYSYKTKELYDEASNMSTLFDQKMEELELRYQIAKSERKESEEMVEKEKKIFESRQKQIDDYLAHKAKKAADKKLRELQEAKSITIQAWWRGVMVRCYLGSFKKYKKRARKIRQEMRAAKSQKSKSKKK